MPNIAFYMGLLIRCAHLLLLLPSGLARTYLKVWIRPTVAEWRFAARAIWFVSIVLIIHLLIVLLSCNLACRSILAHPPVLTVLLRHMLDRHPLLYWFRLPTCQHRAVTQLLLPLLSIIKLLMTTDHSLMKSARRLPLRRMLTLHKSYFVVYIALVSRVILNGKNEKTEQNKINLII